MQKNGINVVRILQPCAAVPQLKHATAQTNPFTAICYVRFISNEGELASQIVRFTFYGLFQQDHTGSRHVDDGRIKRDWKCLSVHVFVPQKPPSLWPPWNLGADTSHLSTLSTGLWRRAIFKVWAHNAPLCMGWARTPKAADLYDKFPQLFVFKSTTIMIFLIWHQILMSGRFLFVEPPFLRLDCFQACSIFNILSKHSF